MAPNAGGAPQEKLLKQLIKTFGTFEKFKENSMQAHWRLFGSGWTWVSIKQWKTRNHEYVKSG